MREVDDMPGGLGTAVCRTFVISVDAGWLSTDARMNCHTLVGFWGSRDHQLQPADQQR